MKRAIKNEESGMKNAAAVLALAALLGAGGAFAGGLDSLRFEGFAHPVENALAGLTLGADGSGAAAVAVGEGVAMEMLGGTVRGGLDVADGASLRLGAGMRVAGGALTVAETAAVETAAGVEVEAAAGGGTVTLGTNAWVFAYGEAVTLRAVAGCRLRFEGAAATAVVGAEGGAAWLDPDAAAAGRAVVVTGYERDGAASRITFRPVLDGAEGHTVPAWFRVSVEEGGLVKVRYAGDLAALAAADGAGRAEETIGTATHDAACDDAEVWFTVVPEAAEDGADGEAEPAQQFFQIVVE